MLKMNYESLRIKNKKILVERALSVYAVCSLEDEEKKQWVKFLIEGGDVMKMMKEFKKLGSSFKENDSSININEVRNSGEVGVEEFIEIVTKSLSK